SCEILLDDLLDAVGAIVKFPVAGRDVDAERLLRVDHVLALRPQSGGRSLPRVATVEQQRAGARRPELFHEGREMREPAKAPVGAGRLREIKVRECMRVAAAGRDAEMTEQMLAHEMRRLALCC